MLDYLFDNVVGRIFDTTSLNKNENINYKETEKWLNEAKAKKLTINDEGGSIPIPSQEMTKAFPLILTKIASYMHSKMHFGQEEFDNRRNREGDNVLYHIYLNYESKTDEIDYTGLDSFLKATIGGTEVSGLLQESNTRRDVIGQSDYTYEDGDTVYQDSRLDNFFNLMFHGVVFEKNYNEFDGTQQHDSMAIFGDGFLSDPVIISGNGSARDMIAACATNRKLFKLDVVPGNPILEFTFDQYKEEAEVKEEEVAELPMLSEARSLGLDTSRFNFEGFTDDDIIAFIERKFDERDSKIFAKGEGDLSKLVIRVDANKVYTLKDVYPEIGNIVS
jgi:hypothetical protein